MHVCKADYDSIFAMQILRHLIVHVHVILSLFHRTMTALSYSLHCSHALLTCNKAAEAPASPSSLYDKLDKARADLRARQRAAQIAEFDDILRDPP